MGEADVKAVVAGMGALARVVHAERPDLLPGYLTVARTGWLRMGVGGALADKILIRVQGPSAKPDDDELVEAKQVQHLGLPCLEPPPTIRPARRVIAGVRQVGRLKHNILAASPELVIPEVEVQGQQLRNGGFAAGTGPTVSSASTISAPCRSWKRSSTTPACNLAVAL